MDALYSLVFNPSIKYKLWLNGGFTIGFFILFIGTFLGTFIYYVVVGKNTRKYAHLKSWLFSLFSTMIVVFLLSLTMLGFIVFQVPDFESIPIDIWIFSLWNSTLYAIVFFFLFSLIFRQFKGNNRSVPIGSRK